MSISTRGYRENSKRPTPGAPAVNGVVARADKHHVLKITEVIMMAEGFDIARQG